MRKFFYALLTFTLVALQLNPASAYAADKNKPRVKFTVTTEKDTYALDEEIVFDMEFKNIGSVPVVLTTKVLGTTEVEVFRKGKEIKPDVDDEVQPWAPVPQILASHEVVLQPGEVMTTYQYASSGRYRKEIETLRPRKILSFLEVSRLYPLTKPGKYRVIFTYDYVYRANEDGSKQGDNLELVAKPIEFTLTE